MEECFDGSSLRKGFLGRRRGCDTYRSGASHSIKTEEEPLAVREPSEDLFTLQICGKPAKPQSSEGFVKTVVNNSCKEDPTTLLR